MMFCERMRPGSAILILSLVTALLPAQTRQFDLYTYTAPEGYTVRASATQVELLKVDQARRSYCQFALQPSQASLGSAATDIDAEWNLLVVKAYRVKSPAATSAFSQPGAPESIVRTAPTSKGNVPNIISTVTVLRFPDRYVSVLFNAPHAEAVEACKSDAMLLYGSIRMNPSAAPAPATQQGTADRIPHGNTPQLFAGSPGWLPSGTGLPIPDPGFVQGLPVGLWWRSEPDARGGLKAVVHVFLSGGIRATFPRMGGGQLFDLDGQKRQAGNTGVGTYAVESGQFVQRYDGFESKGAFSSSSDATGMYFKSGAAIFRPLTPATIQSIAGHWRGAQSDISFRTDGTYIYGSAPASAGSTGRYRLDGYLIQLIPNSAPGVIDRFAMAGTDTLVMGSSALFRVK